MLLKIHNFQICQQVLYLRKNLLFKNLHLPNSTKQLWCSVPAQLYSEHTLFSHWMHFLHTTTDSIVIPENRKKSPFKSSPWKVHSIKLRKEKATTNQFYTQILLNGTFNNVENCSINQNNKYHFKRSNMLLEHWL